MRQILIQLGEDPDREGLQRTPRRVARMYAELLEGYTQDLDTIVNGALFDVNYGADEMVVVADIEYHSMCPDALDFGAIAATLSEAAGRSIRYTPVSNQRMRDILRAARWPERQVAVGVGLFESVRNGRRAPVRDDLSKVAGREPTTFEAFAAANAPVWR
jgi:hypothetical protein